jgi:hypothetical protein
MNRFNRLKSCLETLRQYYLQPNVKLTGQRVLDLEEGLSKIDNRRMKEVDITRMATFWTIPRGDGVLYDEGQGVITTNEDSAEMASEKERGIGQSLLREGKR